MRKQTIPVKQFKPGLITDRSYNDNPGCTRFENLRINALGKLELRKGWKTALTNAARNPDLQPFVIDPKTYGTIPYSMGDSIIARKYNDTEIGILIPVYNDINSSGSLLRVRYSLTEQRSRLPKIYSNVFTYNTRAPIKFIDTFAQTYVINGYRKEDGTAGSLKTFQWIRQETPWDVFLGFDRVFVVSNRTFGIEQGWFEYLSDFNATYVFQGSTRPVVDANLKQMIERNTDGVKKQEYKSYFMPGLIQSANTPETYNFNTNPYQNGFMPVYYAIQPVYKDGSVGQLSCIGWRQEWGTQQTISGNSPASMVNATITQDEMSATVTPSGVYIKFKMFHTYDPRISRYRMYRAQGESVKYDSAQNAGYMQDYWRRELSPSQRNGQNTDWHFVFEVDAPSLVNDLDLSKNGLPNYITIGYDIYSKNNQGPTYNTPTYLGEYKHSKPVTSLLIPTDLFTDNVDVGIRASCGCYTNKTLILGSDKNLIYVSDYDATWSFQTANTLALNAGDTAQEIVALGDNAIVVGLNNIYIMTPTVGSISYNIMVLKDNVSVDSPYSVCVLDGVLYYASDNKVYGVTQDGREVEISANVNKKIAEYIGTNEFSKVKLYANSKDRSIMIVVTGPTDKAALNLYYTPKYGIISEDYGNLDIYKKTGGFIGADAELELLQKTPRYQVMSYSQYADKATSLEFGITWDENLVIRNTEYNDFQDIIQTQWSGVAVPAGTPTPIQTYPVEGAVEKSFNFGNRVIVNAVNLYGTGTLKLSYLTDSQATYSIERTITLKETGVTVPLGASCYILRLLLVADTSTQIDLDYYELMVTSASKVELKSSAEVGTVGN